MAAIKLPEIRPGETLEEKVNALYDAYFMLRKWINYAFSGVLDEDNVIRAREAIIMGPDATISWSQVTGVPEIPGLPSYIKSTYIDETNVISPNITGGVITGALFKTAVDGERLEMDSDGIVSFDKYNTLTGICIGIGTYAFSSLDFYHYDVKVASIQYDGLGKMSFGPLGDAKLYISDVYANGDWDFTLANISGLNIIAKLG
jgi:hypothetical protein